MDIKETTVSVFRYINRGLFGCLDSDADGWSDLNDDFPQNQHNTAMLMVMVTVTMRKAFSLTVVQKFTAFPQLFSMDALMLMEMVGKTDLMHT